MSSESLRLALKRTLDLGVGLALLMFLAVPFAFISLAIKLNSRGPVFIRMERIGKNGKPFFPFKFRTMVKGAVEQGLGYEISQNDFRVTWVGRILRDWGLDELPQLLNVLKGEMSVVGPRPTFAYQVDAYDQQQRRRLLMKPGITGWALVHGRNRIPWEERIEYDLWYVDHWSIWLDIKVMFRTLIVVLVTREGLYGEEGINRGIVESPTQTTDSTQQR